MTKIKYKGIDDKGKTYDLARINWDNMTGLCELPDAMIGWTWCRFEEFTDLDGNKLNQQ